MEEEQIQKWLNKNTEYCETYHAHVRESDCKKRIKKMGSFIGNTIDPGCASCKKFKRARKSNTVVSKIREIRYELKDLDAHEIAAKIGAKYNTVRQILERECIDHRSGSGNNGRN